MLRALTQVWLENITATIPDRASFCEAQTLDDAKGRFVMACDNFRAKHGLGLAKAFEQMVHTDGRGGSGGDQRSAVGAERIRRAMR